MAPRGLCSLVHAQTLWVEPVRSREEMSLPSCCPIGMLQLHRRGSCLQLQVPSAFRLRLTSPGICWRGTASASPASSTQPAHETALLKVLCMLRHGKAGSAVAVRGSRGETEMRSMAEHFHPVAKTCITALHNMQAAFGRHLVFDTWQVLQVQDHCSHFCLQQCHGRCEIHCTGSAYGNGAARLVSI